MPAPRWLRPLARARLLQSWPWLLLLGSLLAVRLSKGAGLADAYALLSRPFWPGTAQAEWLRSARRFEDRARMAALEADNARLRGLLGLQRAAPARLTARSQLSPRTLTNSLRHKIQLMTTVPSLA